MGLFCALLVRRENYHTETEPSHDIVALFVLRKLIFQTRMRSHTIGLDSDFWLTRYYHAL